MLSYADRSLAAGGAPAQLLLLYCCYNRIASLYIPTKVQILMPYCRSVAAGGAAVQLLLLYCCFTAALLTPYCRSLAAGGVKALNYNRIESLGPDKLLLLYCCFTAALLQVSRCWRC